MAINVTKPAINLREKLNEVTLETGIKGEELLNSDTSTEARNVLELDTHLFTDFESTGIDDNATSTAITIDASENVGIGTSSPAAMLHLSAPNSAGIIRLENKFDTPDNVWEIVPSIAGVANTGFTIRDVTDNANRLVINGSGNVGIGTSSPSEALDLVGNFISATNKTNNTDKQAVFLSHQYAITSEPEGFMMMETYSGASDNRIDIGGGHSGYNSATSITFNTGANTTTRTGSESMRITSAGRVGIGTSNPERGLHVTGGFVIGGGYQYVGAHTGDGLWGATATPNRASPTGNGDLLLGYQDNSSGLYSAAYGFEVKSTDGAANTDRVVHAIRMKDISKGTYPFHVKNNGAGYFQTSVGIGTSSPATGLEIKQAADNANSGLRITRSGENTYGNLFIASTGEGQSDPIVLQHSNGTRNLMAWGRDGTVVVPNGNLVIGTSGKGIDFSATSDGSGTMTSEVLDDYEEGTWTPGYTDNTNNGTMHSDNAGVYTKVGNVVTVSFRARSSALNGMSGQIYIAGLPFTPESTTSVNKVAGSSVSYFVLLAIPANTVPLIRINNGQTRMQITLTGSTTGTVSFVSTNLTDGGLLAGSFSYIAA